MRKLPQSGCAKRPIRHEQGEGWDPIIGDSAALGDVLDRWLTSYA